MNSLFPARKLMTCFRRIATTGLRDPQLGKLLDILANQGFDVTALKEWTPKAEDARALKDAAESLSIFLYAELGPESRNVLIRKTKASLQGLPQGVASNFQDLIESIKSAPPRIRKQKPKSSDPFADLLPSLSVDMVQAQPPRQEATNGPFDFQTYKGPISIYFDEAFELPDGGRTGSVLGAFVGIVWAGSRADPAVLPELKLPGNGHIRGMHEMKAAMSALRECKRTLPFVLVVNRTALDGDVGGDDYRRLMEAAVQFLLGWGLPKNEGKRDLFLHFERQGGHAGGEDRTEYFRGLLRGWNTISPQRFGNWCLCSAKWQDKNYGYIPYADILAYSVQESDKGRELADWLHPERLPGYVAFNSDLVNLLDKAEKTDSGIELLDLADHATTQHIASRLADDLRPLFQRRPEIKSRIISELDRRYRAKDRDLRSLRRQLAVCSQLVGELPPDAPLVTKLLWTAIELQEANHAGNGAKAESILPGYAGLSEKGLQNGLSDLVAHCELNIAVGYADRFLLDNAFDTVENLDTSRFPGLRDRGKILSSAGQYRSMLGFHAEAEEAFVEALKCFADMESTPAEKAGEIDQTAVYRAINALDGDFPNSQDLVTVVLGDLNSAAARFAPSHEKPYHHHLFLRSIWSMDGCDRARKCYADKRPSWIQGYDHPWELIEMYRGLLMASDPTMDAKQNASGCFNRAIEIATVAPHGDTLQLIAGMIACVASCCFQGDAYPKKTAVLLNGLPDRLPAAKPRIERLLEIAHNPAPDMITVAMAQLPFNYH